jgi:hypothetical protein
LIIAKIKAITTKLARMTKIMTTEIDTHAVLVDLKAPDNHIYKVPLIINTDAMTRV